MESARQASRRRPGPRPGWWRARRGAGPGWARRRRAVAPEQREAARERGEHAQAEEVDLEQVERGEVVLVPLDDGPARHGGRLDGDGLAERPAVMTNPPTWMERWRGKPFSSRRERRASSGPAPSPPRRARPARGAPGPTAATSSYVPTSLARRSTWPSDSPSALPTSRRADFPVGDDLADHAGPLAAVALVDVLEDLLAPLVLEVHVYVGRLAALGGDEALEEEPHPHRVDGGDPERRSRPPSWRRCRGPGRGSRATARSGRCPRR